MLYETSSSETSSNDFNFDQFKYGTTEAETIADEQEADFTTDKSGQLQNKSKSVRFSPNAKIQEGIKTMAGVQKKFVYYLGMKFPLEAIKERNYYPNHALVPVYLCLFLGLGSFLFIFIFGTKFELVSIILSVFVTMFGMTGMTILLKKPIKNGIKLKENRVEIILFVIATSLNSALIIYAFLKKIPFNSIGIFLITLYASTFFSMVGVLTVTTFNTDDNSDPNYLYKFYYKRIMMSILIATGTIDTLSDIALGARIFQDYNDYIKFLGLFLFILCSVDLFIVNVRLISPDKVSIRMHISAVILEIFIIIISILAVVKIKKEQLSSEFIGLLVVSFFTTGVSFLHHLFVIAEWYQDLQRNRIITYIGGTVQ